MRLSSPGAPTLRAPEPVPEPAVEPPTEAPMKKPVWVNIITLALFHVLAVTAIFYLILVKFSWWSIGLGTLWMVCAGLSVTGGYHRLFAHQTYRACRPLRLFYLLFGAASIQNSALKWSADHRVHHARTDRDEDPYNIRLGFWWAHIGWVLFDRNGTRTDESLVRDLNEDPLIRFQDRYYVPLAFLMAGILPIALGFLWGDPLGAVLLAAFLRTVLQWHATFFVNSLAHLVGDQPYSTKTSARDSSWTAIFTLGEGYHNFHHRFQNDYRNGVRWYHFDPTKWFVFSLSKVGFTSGLRRASSRAIEFARQSELARTQQSVRAP